MTLASHCHSQEQLALVMLAFGIGAALPLELHGMLSREVMLRIRGTLVKVGSSGKYALGLLMIIVAISILAGFDRSVEAHRVQWSPDWLSGLTTRY